MSLFDRVVFVHLWPFLDYHSQLAIKQSCRKFYDWGRESALNLPDFRDFYYADLFQTAPVILYQCKVSQYIRNSLVWVYRNGDTVLQIYFHMIKMWKRDSLPIPFPAIWHIKLDYLTYDIPGGRNYIRGYSTERGLPCGGEFLYDDVLPHPNNLVVYRHLRDQIRETSFEKIWPGCMHGETHPENICIHGKCPSCKCCLN